MPYPPATPLAVRLAPPLWALLVAPAWSASPGAETSAGWRLTAYALVASLLLLLPALVWVRQLQRNIASRREAEEKFRVLFERTIEPHLVLGARQILDCNEAAVRILGAKHKRELIGMEPGRLSPPEQPDGRTSHEKALEMMRRAHDQGHHRFEWMHQRLDGSPLPVEVSLSPIELGGEEQLICVWHDLTHRKQTEHELQTARIEAEQANLAKSAFLANMSHEIRTPMNAIVNMQRLALAETTDPKVRKYLEVIGSSSENLMALIDDILDFSKIEAGRMEIENVPIDLPGLIDEVIDTFRARVVEKELEFVVALDPALPERVQGDPLRLRQVLTNLLSNAFKFTDTGEVVLTVGFEPPAPEARRVALDFEVRDTGTGIPPETQKKLFRSFSQADESTSRQYGGTGLGLAISDRLVRLMGGERIFLDSQPGQGSRFRFRLALAFERRAPALPVAPEPLRERGVLVVEDGAGSREALAALFESLGIPVRSAADADQALALLEGSEPLPEMAFIDWRLPGMDGISLARHIRSQPRLAGIRLILCSLYLSADPGKPDRQAFDGVLQKPITRETLLDLLLRLCDGFDRCPWRPPRPRPAANFQGARVLLAEDNELNRFVAREVLERAGLQLDCARDGNEALRMIAEQAYAAVLMDVQMPELDGLEATRRIRRLPGRQELPIIAMTANAMKGDENRCLEAGMNDYIVKPIDPEALYRSLGRWISSIAPPPPKTDPTPDPARPALHGLDLETSAARLHMEPERFLGLLRRFPDSAEPLLERLEGAAHDEQPGEVAAAAHALAGSAGNIGADTLFQLAKNLEDCAATGGDYRRHLDAPLEECRRINTSIRANSPEPAQPETPPVGPAGVALQNAIEQLAAALELLDLRAVHEARDRLCELEIPRAWQRRFERILQRIEHYRFNDALALLEPLRQTPPEGNDPA